MKSPKFGLCLFLVPVIMTCGCAANKSEVHGEEGKVLLRSEGGGICRETRSGRMWQKGRSGMHTLAEAGEYVARLRLGGHDDWRLPTRKESLDLLNMFYWKRNGDCAMNIDGEYWTGAGDRNKASLGHWEDYLLCGPEFKYVKSAKAKGYVRAIRP